MPKTLSILLLTVFFTPIETRASDWVPMFRDGLLGWTDQKGNPVTNPGWSVEGGLVHLDRERGAGGNILTEREYGDFELVFEWKVAERANNGIKYRVKDFDGRVLGIEYQVIDDANRQLKPKHRTASIYDIYETRPHDILRPHGEFNRGRILVQGSRIEHWLNGFLVAIADIGGTEWKERIGRSKFSKVDGFGRNHFGRIMFTDHSDEVWYRNVFIRDLEPPPISTSVSSSSVGTSDCCPVQVRSRPRRKLFSRLRK